ncbi:MAG TPA: hypothetical protein VHA53_03015 [Nitrolancea sp.]|nr:hypothetical protein [Nitrolancea sp.]
MTFSNAPVPHQAGASTNDRSGSDAAMSPLVTSDPDRTLTRQASKPRSTFLHATEFNPPHGSQPIPGLETDDIPFERGSLARLSPRERFEARRLARERAAVGLPSGPRLFLPLKLILAGALASLRRQTRDIRRDASYMIGRLPYRPVVTGTEYLPYQRPYIILSNHYERRPGAWVGWGGCVIIDAIANARPGDYPIRWVMTSAWEDFHIGPWFVDPRHLRWALQRFADLYGIILTPSDDRRVFGRGAALREIFHALADPNGQVVAFHPEAGGTQSLIRPPHGVGRFLTMLDRRGVPLVPVGVFEDGRRFHVTFGQALPHGALDGLSDADSAERVMRAIAELLPARNRGIYGERSDSP